MAQQKTKRSTDRHEVSVELTNQASDFDEFYRVQYPRIVRVLMGMTGRWSLSEEIAQESMMQVHHHWARVRRFDRPDLWLRRVAVNRAISSRRRLVTEIGALRRVRLPAATELIAPADERIWDAIRRLPRKQGAAMVLWAVEDLSHREIATALGCSEDTARTHIRRARAALQRALSEEVQ